MTRYSNIAEATKINFSSTQIDERIKLGWAKILDLAEESGEFQPIDKMMVRSWLTCAVGEKQGFPEDKPDIAGAVMGEEDEELERLGIYFMSAVKQDAILEARSLYHEIVEHGTVDSD